MEVMTPLLRTPKHINNKSYSSVSCMPDPTISTKNSRAIYHEVPDKHDSSKSTLREYWDEFSFRGTQTLEHRIYYPSCQSYTPHPSLIMT